VPLQGSIACWGQSQGCPEAQSAPQHIAYNSEHIRPQQTLCRKAAGFGAAQAPHSRQQAHGVSDRLWWFCTQATCTSHLINRLRATVGSMLAKPTWLPALCIPPVMPQPGPACAALAASCCSRTAPLLLLLWTSCSSTVGMLLLSTSILKGAQPLQQQAVARPVC
jgi:hypothetical protein